MTGRRRTKRQYAELFDNPRALFPTVETTLFPNGEREIWVKDETGRFGLTITVSAGPRGFGLTVRRHVGTPALNNMSGNGEQSDEIEIAQYADTDEAQAFRRWYLREETDDDVSLLGPQYRRLPRVRDEE